MGNKYHKATVSCWLFALVATLEIINHGCVEGKRVLDENYLGVKRRGTIKTIMSHEDGDVIDCVDIYKQPAFDNPLIKNLQMELSTYPSGKSKLFQNWHKYGKCPQGTVPIKRTWNHTIHRKEPGLNHVYAAVYSPESHYRGGIAGINVWNPFVALGDVFSLSQIWIQSDLHSEDMNTIEAGWIVNSRRYGDYLTRFFIYWTRDNYHETGCYDLDCPGFVQTHRNFGVGCPIIPISDYNKLQYDITVNISMDDRTGHWWLTVQGETLGFWPFNIFNSLGNGAELVSWGGEIVDNQLRSHPTNTQMGSGHFPSEGFGKSSFFRNVMVKNDANAWIDAAFSPYVSRPTCYNVHLGDIGTTYKKYFFYGGPGYSAQCQ